MFDSRRCYMIIVRVSIIIHRMIATTIASLVSADKNEGPRSLWTGVARGGLRRESKGERDIMGEIGNFGVFQWVQADDNPVHE
jgi:hypothetical protein